MTQGVRGEKHHKVRVPDRVLIPSLKAALSKKMTQAAVRKVLIEEGYPICIQTFNSWTRRKFRTDAAKYDYLFQNKEKDTD